MTTWITVETLLPRVRLQVPERTKAGEEVAIPEHQHKGIVQAHPQSPDSCEVYFEVVMYPQPIDITQMFESQRTFILEKDERKTNATVGELNAAACDGRTAQQAEVRFDTNGQTFERRFVFLNVADVEQPFGLRMVFDPRSPTNHEILQRLRIAPNP